LVKNVKQVIYLVLRNLIMS